MNKIKINIEDLQKVEVDTLEGYYLISSKKIDGQISGNNNNFNIQLNIPQLATILTIVSIACAVTWHYACTNTKNELTIEYNKHLAKLREECQEKYTKLRFEYQEKYNQLKLNTQQEKIDSISNALNNKNVHSCPNGKITQFYNGQVGIIDEKILKENQHKRSSFNKPYFLDKNICEYNTSYTFWSNTNKAPKPLFFYELLNEDKQLKSWCMIIGSFTNIQNPHRVFVISKKTAHELGFGLKEGVINIKWRRMSESEWSSCKECLNLRDNVYRFNGK